VKYRIRMNGKGECYIERKRWIFWSPWPYIERRSSNGELRDQGWDFTGVGTIFPNNEEACKALLRAQEYDAQCRLAGQWTTVLEDEPK
jgi:hypothetical protein